MNAGSVRVQFGSYRLKSCSRWPRFPGNDSCRLMLVHGLKGFSIPSPTSKGSASFQI
jgi:hypothetical protein